MSDKACQATQVQLARRLGAQGKVPPINISGAKYRYFDDDPLFKSAEEAEADLGPAEVTWDYTRDCLGNLVPDTKTLKITYKKSVA